MSHPHEGAGEFNPASGDHESRETDSQNNLDQRLQELKKEWLNVVEETNRLLSVRAVEEMVRTQAQLEVLHHRAQKILDDEWTIQKQIIEGWATTDEEA